MSVSATAFGGRRRPRRSARSGRRCRRTIAGSGSELLPALRCSWLRASHCSCVCAHFGRRRRARSRAPAPPGRSSRARSSSGRVRRSRRRAGRFQPTPARGAEGLRKAREGFLERALAARTAIARRGHRERPAAGSTSSCGVARELARVGYRQRGRALHRSSPAARCTGTPARRRSAAPVRAPRRATRRGRGARWRDRHRAPGTARRRRSRTWLRSGCVGTGAVAKPGGRDPVGRVALDVGGVEPPRCRFARRRRPRPSPARPWRRSAPRRSGPAGRPCRRLCIRRAGRGRRCVRAPRRSSPRRSGGGRSPSPAGRV